MCSRRKMTTYSGLSLGHLLLLYQKSGQSEQCREGRCGTKDQDASFLLENKSCSMDFHFYHANIYIYIQDTAIPYPGYEILIPYPSPPTHRAWRQPIRGERFFFTRTPVFLALRFSSRPAHATRTSSEQLRFCVSRAVCDQAAPRRSPRPVRRVLEPLPPGCCHQTTLHRRFPVRVLHVASPDVAGKRHVVSLFV